MPLMDNNCIETFESDVSLKTDTSNSDKNQKTKTSEKAVKYGELVILGYNGSLSQGDKGRRRSKLALYKWSIPNGVKPVKHHIVKNPQQSELIKNKHQHSVSYTLSRSQTIIVQYDLDSKTDMFQIGRSSEEQIDFVVVDTIPGDKRGIPGDTTPQQQSTISRFACRILVDRSPPHFARIYAAGFDAAKNIFLGEKATKWYSEGKIDGLTTNGILVMSPHSGFNGSDSPNGGVWREVSVEGGLYALRESRSTPDKNSLVSTESNILQDGTLIDLCGATLLWRTEVGLQIGPDKRLLELQIERLNASRPQCPVGLNTLVLPSKVTASLKTSHTDKTPFVYIACGHVHGQHSWGKGDDNNSRTCPMCRKTGPFVRLQLGLETSFYISTEALGFCFSPCGHIANELTVKYWASVLVPHGCQGFQSACPFCATTLSKDNSYVKLIFQDHID